MKYIINHVSKGEESLTLNYCEESPEVNRILQFMNQKRIRLIGKTESDIVTVNPDEILFIETVDDKTFAYTTHEVIRLEYSLVKVLEVLDDIRFFRCSKSMILNVDKVERLKSLSSNRIDCMMVGGEHILISRTYASDFRKLLKGER